MIRVLLIALLALAGTMVRAADPATEEMKKLEGQWQVIEVVGRGKKEGKDDEEVKTMRWVITGDAITLPDPTGLGDGRKKTFKLDPAKTPKEIDITSLDGQEKNTTAAGVYKLENDRLTICIPYYTTDQSVRPKEFKSRANNDLMVITLERIKVL